MNDSWSSQTYTCAALPVGWQACTFPLSPIWSISSQNTLTYSRYPFSEDWMARQPAQSRFQTSLSAPHHHWWAYPRVSFFPYAVRWIAIGGSQSLGSSCWSPDSLPCWDLRGPMHRSVRDTWQPRCGDGLSQLPEVSRVLHSSVPGCRLSRKINWAVDAVSFQIPKFHFGYFSHVSWLAAALQWQRRVRLKWQCRVAVSWVISCLPVYSS